MGRRANGHDVKRRGGGAGKISFDDLHIAALMDKATPALLKYCASGKHISEIKLSVCKAGGTQIEYATIILKDAITTKVQFSGTSNTEQVKVNYEFQSSKIEQHY
jgi:type VI secretion system secreted protein Hcp